jgi:hypothetical protein
MTEQTKTLTLDGVSYEVAQFSDGIQSAVNIYNAFAADLQKAQLEVVKCQSAMQSVGAQISTAVKAELEAKAAPAAEVEAEVVPAAE